MLQYSLLGLKVALIKTEQKLLLYARVFLALGWDTLDAFMRIREDYVRKDIGVLGLTNVVEFSVSWKLLPFVDRDREIRLRFGSKAPETEVAITSDNNKIIHYSTSR